MLVLRKNLLLNISIFFCLFFLCSPGLSPFWFFFSINFPNEKIALLFAGLICLFCNLRIHSHLYLLHLLAVCLNILNILTFSLVVDKEFNGLFSYINLMVSMASFILYFSVFYAFKEKCLYYIKIIFYLLLFVFFIQIFTVDPVHGKDLASVIWFKSNSMQVNATSPPGSVFSSLPRASSLFFEASQFASFIGLIAGTGVIALKRFYLNIFLYFCIILTLLVCDSISGYMCFFASLFCTAYYKRRLLNVKYISLIFMIFVGVVIFSYEKIIKNFNNEFGYVRVNATFAKLKTIFENNLFYPNGFDWSFVSGDFLSIYFYALGLLGLIGTSIWVSSFLIFKEIRIYFPCLLILMMSNGYINSSIFYLFILMPILFINHFTNESIIK